MLTSGIYLAAMPITTTLKKLVITAGSRYGYSSNTFHSPDSSLGTGSANMPPTTGLRFVSARPDRGSWCAGALISRDVPKCHSDDDGGREHSKGCHVSQSLIKHLEMGAAYL